MIIELLVDVSTEVLQRPAELDCRILHDLVHNALPGGIIPGGKYFIFDFSMCPVIRIPLEDLCGYLDNVGYKVDTCPMSLTPIIGESVWLTEK